jgi:quercetin dioxygenase-like cupin family protein
MEIKRAGSQPSAKGPEAWFTGTVRIDAPFKGSDGARVGGATVTFEPGAHRGTRTRSAKRSSLPPGWDGSSARAAPVEEIRPGDIVWFAPGEKQWHGAAPSAR